MKTCSIDGCNKKYFCSGLCTTHYTRKQKYGSPNVSVREYSIWTKEEEEIIKREYPKIGYIGVSEILTHRTKNSIKTRAYDLGIKSLNRRPGNNKKYAVGISGQISFIYSLHKNAKNRNLAVTISDEEIIRLSQLPCSYCGSSKSGVSGRGWGKFTHNGIDRVDNKKGYIEGNVVPCCGICNRMKLNMNIKDFLAHIQKINIHVFEKDSIENW